MAYCLNALLSTRLRAVEVERKLRETDELEQRLAALELATSLEGKPRWGN